MTMRRRTALGLGLAAFANPWLGALHAQSPGATFSIATNLEPDSLDSTASRNVLGVRPLMCNVTEALISVTPEGKLVPGVADWTVSADGRTVEFKIKPGIKFSSGDPLTAADIVWADERQASPTATNAQYKTYRNKIFESAEVVDERTVRFHLKQVDPAYLYLRLVLIVSKAYHDRVGDKAFSEQPVGTGPYKLASYKPGESLDLTAYDGYRGPQPAVKSVRFLFVKEDNTRVAKLRAGEVDMIMNVPYTAVKALEGAGFGLAKLAVPPTESLRFYFANKKAPWADVRVRMAMAHAIDTKAIVDGLFQGVPLGYPGLAPGEPGYDPDLKPYAYDPALAKKLLAEAGFPNGFKMVLHFWVNQVVGVQDAAAAIILYLKAVGIEASGDGADVGTMIQTLAKVRRDEAIEYISISPVQLADNTDPMASLLASYQSDSATSAYINPEFDRLIADIGLILDETQRAAAIKKAVRILHDDVAMIPLWTQVSVYAMRKGVSYRPTERYGIAILDAVNLKVG